MIYKPEYVRELATEIMQAAENIITKRAILGGIIGAVVGYALGLAVGGGGGGSIVGAAILAFIFYINAQNQVLLMRAQAQLMLTQIEIEKNTRAS